MTCVFSSFSFLVIALVYGYSEEVSEEGMTGLSKDDSDTAVDFGTEQDSDIAVDFDIV